MVSDHRKMKGIRILGNRSNWGTGCLCDLSDDPFSSSFLTWNSHGLNSGEGTHFGFVFEGEALLKVGSRNYPISAGMYFSVPGDFEIIPEAPGSRGIVMSRHGYEGVFMLGGPVEEKGRLQYIDGCTDSLLIPPVMMGDPCLNLLHIPPGTEQTQHTHPSLRLGMIISGTGECRTPGEVCPLNPGTLFHIPAGGVHSFFTGDDSLRVIAYHPDSDFGPTHENHPMVNKTII